MSLLRSGPTAERALIGTSVAMSVATIILGYYLAHRTGDAHWMNRCGAGIVAFQAAMAIVESARRRRLRKLASIMERQLAEEEDGIADHTRRFLEAQVRRAETNVLSVAVLMAVVGELLHGFGDLLI